MNDNFHVSVSEVSFLEWRSCCVVKVGVRADFRDIRLSCLLLSLVYLGLLLLMHSLPYSGLHLAHIVGIHARNRVVHSGVSIVAHRAVHRFDGAEVRGLVSTERRRHVRPRAILI